METFGIFGRRSLTVEAQLTRQGAVVKEQAQESEKRSVKEEAYSGQPMHDM